jgi:hypothetical protein
MNLVEVPYGGRLGHELPNALVKGAVDEQIAAGDCSATLATERLQSNQRVSVSLRKKSHGGRN